MSICGRGDILNSTIKQIVFLLLVVFQLTIAANILAVFPSVWKSHYLYGRTLLEQMVKEHNHTVTLISGYGDDSTSELIEEIQIDGLHENWIDIGLSFNIEEIRENSIIDRITRLIYAGTTGADLLLSDQKVQNLLRTRKHFDLLIVDLFLSDSLLGLSYYYQIPTIALSANGANAWLNYMAGNPQSSALDPSNFLPFLEKMSMWERILNTLMGIFERLNYNFFHTISQETVYKKHFTPLFPSTATIPHHRELTENLSIILINSHPVVQYPRAYLPNMIEIGGAHLQTELKFGESKVPQHLKEFIEGAKDGVIYMSLGANVQTADLSHDKLDSFLHAFEALGDSIRILLKWEHQQINFNLPTNVMINDWFPQQAILAHENVKIFITSAGLMSTIEAIHYHTPMLIIPIYPEQEVTAKRLQNHGCAVHLRFESICYDQLLNLIHELHGNHSYMENIQHLSKLLDIGSPVGSPIAKAMHYIEIVLRTSGAPHLKSHANHLDFLKTELVDVILIILAGIFCIIAVPFLVICCILRKSYNSSNNAIAEQKKNSLRTSVATTTTTTSDVQILEHHRTKTMTTTSAAAAAVAVSSVTPSSVSSSSSAVSSKRNSICEFAAAGDSFQFCLIDNKKITTSPICMEIYGKGDGIAGGKIAEKSLTSDNG